VGGWLAKWPLWEILDWSIYVSVMDVIAVLDSLIPPIKKFSSYFPRIGGLVGFKIVDDEVVEFLVVEVVVDVTPLAGILESEVELRIWWINRKLGRCPSFMP